MAILTRTIQAFLIVIFIFLRSSWTLSFQGIEHRRDLFNKEFLLREDTKIFRHHPVRTHKNGQFIEFVTLDSFLDESRKENTRTLNQRTGNDNHATTTDDGLHEVFFNLGHSAASPLSGALLHLKRNRLLLSPNFVVQEMAVDGKVVTKRTYADDCHYHGVIHNHDGFSKVALSLCNGLQGVILKDDDHYFVEPQWNNTNGDRNYFSTTSSPLNEITDDKESHPHVIVKQSKSQRFANEQKNRKDSESCGYSVTDLPRSRMNWPEKSTSKNSNLNHNHDRSSNVVQKRDYKHREKRSISLERNVETLVVADKTLVSYHGRQSMESYILTIMNIVASLYHDSSVGNLVNIVVTRIVLLTEEQPNLHISHHADASLKSFCDWQNQINVNLSDPSSESGFAHHDNAVLLTGYDICKTKDEPCGTLGVAPVSGMCDPLRSCNINEDTGLSSAFTIAHEMGHNFGMLHDGEENTCGPENGAPMRIMASQLRKNANPFEWSSCSKDYITRFFESGMGDCLLNSPPQQDFSFPEEEPGQIHNGDEQCRFQYGAQSRQCNIGDTCRELWCLAKNGKCVTNSLPAAQGTSCSSDTIVRGWCYQSKCVVFGYRPTGIDGAWGRWSPWKECSRTCGTGASSSMRSCDSPPPEHGGRYCVGERIRYRICNTRPCSGPPRDFRVEQCQRFDTEPFHGKYYNWLPFHADDKPCALNCMAQGQNFYTERAPAVIDGTPCKAESRDICINGQCHHVGCDLVLHSTAKEDKCRICGGDGSSCQTESGVFNELALHHGYHDVIIIPRGSVHIDVEELQVSQQNYIALRSADNVDYINGGFAIDYPQKFEIAGTVFTYKRKKTEIESLHALGPTNEDLVLMIIIQNENHGIKYEYNVPVEKHGSGGAESAFLWEHGEWTPCSSSCAGGMQQRPILCMRVDDGTVVQDSFCDPLTMPVELKQSCNEEPCPPFWKAGSWSDCSRSCGGGFYTRVVMCVRKITDAEEEEVNDQYCSGDKPRVTGNCADTVCPPEWVTESWSACKPSCGAGFKTRRVTCKSSDRRQAYDESVCDAVIKPSLKISCNNRPCPLPRWQADKWSACSAQCGRGVKRRRVVCYNPATGTLSRLCHRSSMPKTTQSCESPCNNAPNSGGRSEKPCIDDPKVTYCHLVRRFRFCKRSYFRAKCCHTCST